MSDGSIPPDILAVCQAYRACEFATVAKDGTPIAWPTSPIYLEDRGQFLVTTSIGLAQKAYNVRRNAHVSLLFSDPTGSGLVKPPAVLVQGDAFVATKYATWNADLAKFWQMIAERQPASSSFKYAPLRFVMDFYYRRLLIYVTPRRVRWWAEGDFSQTPGDLVLAPATSQAGSPHILEASHVD